MTDFDQFWAEFPRRVGKLAAQKAFVKARKIASQQEIIDGVRRYVANKPDYADYCHPQTWLNQGRWLDEPDRRSGTDRRMSRGGILLECPHAITCASRWACGRKQQHEQWEREAS